MANFSGHIEEKSLSSWTKLFSNTDYLGSDLCCRPLGDIDASCNNYMPKLVCDFITLRVILWKTIGFSSLIKIFEYFKWIMKISMVV